SLVSMMCAAPRNPSGSGTPRQHQHAGAAPSRGRQGWRRWRHLADSAAKCSSLRRGTAIELSTSSRASITSSASRPAKAIAQEFAGGNRRVAPRAGSSSRHWKSRGARRRGRGWPRRARALRSRPMPSPHQRDFTLEPADTERLANLAGPFDAHLRQIELRLGVEIANRGNVFRVTGQEEPHVVQAERLLRTLYAEAGEETFDGQAINLRMNAAGVDPDAGTTAPPADDDYVPQEVSIRVRRGTIRGRGPNQQKYLHAIATHDINFGIGPAGTGKTFLAVASAVEALN